MKDRTGWQGKVFDEPRVGFVDQFGSRLQRPLPPPEHPPEPPPPPPSPLDKVLDENRLGFAEEQRQLIARMAAGSAKAK